MKEHQAPYLACPDCRQALSFKNITAREGPDILDALLYCAACEASYPVAKGVPRFVPPDNYASSFGFEWLQHARTQYDAETGAGYSRGRFFEVTRWPEQMPGEILLEVGSGSGRFTTIAAGTGAMVVSMDYSRAVDANFASNGRKDNVLIVQGDLYRMPFPAGHFDRLFCLGVLQHTPDVEKAFKTLPAYLRPGGYIAVDVYAKMRGALAFLLRLTSTHYRVRAITKRMDHRKLYRFCERYIHFMWPLAKRISRIPRAGPFLLRRLCIPPYFGVYDLPEERLREWMILDMFDALSPAYDSPQFIDVVERWFRESDLDDMDVAYGPNGINGRARKKS